MSECEKCIRAQDARDPYGAATRAYLRALWKANADKLPTWTLPDDADGPMACVDCAACGRHVLVGAGETWCFMCKWELSQVENHVGPPVETGLRIGDIVRFGFSVGPVRYIDPSGFVDFVSSGWTIRAELDELDLVERAEGSAA